MRWQGRRVLVTATDSIGDLVLRQPLISMIADGCAALAVAGKPLIRHLLPAMEPRAELILCDAEGDRWKSAREWKPDVVLCPLKNPTTDDIELLETTGADTRICLRALSDQTFSWDPTIRQRRVRAGEIANHIVECDEWSHDCLAYDRVAERLDGVKRTLPLPVLKPVPSARLAAGELIASLGLVRGEYAVVAPAGISNVPGKFLPLPLAGEIVRHLDSEKGIRSLLVGIPAEGEILEDTRRLAAEKGADPIVWVGQAEEFPLLLGLIEAARILVGIDSAPVHLAGALGIPLVAVYGGGTFGRFLPKAKKAAWLARRMPCYGCEWQCWIGRVRCLEGLSARAVVPGIDHVLAAGDGVAEIRLDESPEDAASDCVNTLRTTVASLNADRDERLAVIHDEQAKVERLRRHINEIDANREEQLELIRRQEKAVAELQGHLDDVSEDRERQRAATEEQRARVKEAGLELERLRKRLAVFRQEVDELRTISGSLANVRYQLRSRIGR